MARSRIACIPIDFAAHKGCNLRLNKRILVSVGVRLANRKTGYRHELAEIELFANLSDKHLDELESRFELLAVKGGEALILEGAPSDTLYLVVSGRFHVLVQGAAKPVAEIGTGACMGEIGFFSGGPRTATVSAARDSLVLQLKRDDFDALCKRSPEIWPNVAAMLAGRLLQIKTVDPQFENRKTRTIAVCHAGPGHYPDAVMDDLHQVFQQTSSCRVLTARTLNEEVSPKGRNGHSAVTRWLNDEEAKHDYLFFVADEELTDWSQLTIRHADMVLFIGMHDAGNADANKPLNKLERYAQEVHGADAQRLVLVHGEKGEISGTRHWLEDRKLHMHHHVRAGAEADYRRLARFIMGRAVGLVACGGGAFCAAHIGLFQAFNEAGLEFDILGGTSGGAAMIGAYAKGIDPDEIDRLTHDIFVTRKAMRRATWPRYSLLDHKVFDESLAEHYGQTRIEDLPIPYFAVSTNLSKNRLVSLREGLLWRSIRASSAIPGLLPPVYTVEGEMLVDGSLLDNVPLRQMCELKSGPNVVVNFQPPDLVIRNVDYDALPSRARLIKSMLLPFLYRSLPKAPGPVSILTRSLAVNRQDFKEHLTGNDLVLVPPLPGDMSILDWQRHTELKQLAYQYGRDELAFRQVSGHPLLSGQG